MTHMLGIVISYSPSFAPTPVRKRTCDSPSMLFATELPRKRDFGRSSPQRSSPCSGEAKYLYQRTVTAEVYKHMWKCGVRRGNMTGLCETDHADTGG